MAKLTSKQIRDLALEHIKKTPGGLRYSEIVKLVSDFSPETSPNTINGSIWNLDTLFPTQIGKPSRGLFAYIRTEAEPQESEPVATTPNIRESDFYEPFAEWLKKDLDEATETVALGGASLKSKWGTPDVVGVYKPSASNLIKFPIEIISTEIKIDPSQPVVAFGQAVAYRLFSAKSYIAMPITITAEEYSRLEALCILYGVGLVLFKLDKEAPDFSIRVRAARTNPDMFYVNEFADRLKQSEPQKFEMLFR